MKPTMFKGIYNNTPDEYIPDQMMDKIIVCKYILQEELGHPVELRVSLKTSKVLCKVKVWWLDLISETHYLLNEDGSCPEKGEDPKLNAGYQNTTVKEVYRRAKEGLTLTGHC